MHARSAAALLILAMFLFGCDGDKTPTPAEKASGERSRNILETWKIGPESENILYTYMDEYNRYQTTDNPEDIPVAYRNDVIVVNLNQPPEKRLASTRVVVADLMETDESGHYRLRIEDRAGFENALKLKRDWKLSQFKQTPQNTTPSSPVPPIDYKSDKIVLYSASWCGYCKKTRDYLKSKDVDFIEKDIEKDPGAMQELQDKCAWAKIECSGVPVLDWMGNLIPGFHQPTIDRFIRNPPAPATGKIIGAQPPKAKKP